MLVLVGAAGLVAGFLSAPSSVAEAQAMVADAHHGGGHGETHGEAATISHGDSNVEKNSHVAETTEAHEDDHGEHLLHQLQNKPWAALYVAAFFFMMIALGTLAFYAIQRAAQAGWSLSLIHI